MRWVVTRSVAVPALRRSDCGRRGTATPEVVIDDPYIDLHTGPGRGYPIFFVAERGEQIALLKRRTEWFKVRVLVAKKGGCTTSSSTTT